MSFPEVIYRHGAQYCFNICRSRLVGLIITLILMQIFLFSFYLNGLHSQDATRSDSVNTILGNDSTFRHVVSTVKEPQQKVASVVKGPSADSPINKAKTFVSDVGKKALDKVMANKLPNVDLMNMVARKLSADSNNPVAKTGMNLIAHAINNMKNYQQSQQSKKVTIDEKNSSILSNRVENDFETEASSSTLRPLDSRVLEIISQLMRQRLQSTAEFNPQIVESAMKRLKNAITTQKIDPKNLLGLISKMRQLQSISNDSHSNGPGYELLSQLLSNNQLTSALTGLTTKPVSASQSKMIYDKYVKITNKKLPKLKSKMAYPYWSQSGKVVVDIGFRYFTEKVNACRPNATYLILSVSSAANTDERQAARETWIKDLHQLIGDQVDVAFVIGQTSNVTVQRTVLNESTIYNDLIETNVQEPIESAVYKTLAGLVWIENNCPNVEQILKVDDDVYVSAARMLRIFKEGKAKATLTGRMIDDMNPHTTSDKRFQIGKKSWPLKEFPRFLDGGAYLIGRTAVPRLLAAAQLTPVLPLESVYLTGLCASGGKVELISNKSLFEEEIDEELDTCTFEDFASWRSTGADDVRQTWNFAQAMKRSGEICVPTNKCARTFMGICIPKTL